VLGPRDEPARRREIDVGRRAFPLGGEARRIDLPAEITTDRLVLRAWRPGDGLALQQAADDVIETTNGWLPGTRERMVAADVDIDPRAPERLVCDRVTGRVLGSISVNAAVPGDGWCEVGWWLGPDGRGRGLGTEAMRTYVDALFAAGMTDVEVATSVDNAAVARVMEKLGAERRRAGDRTLPNGTVLPALVFVLRPRGSAVAQAESEP
jgi:RimJ/RimL family protein N-acetyltransferase